LFQKYAVTTSAWRSQVLWSNLEIIGTHVESAFHSFIARTSQFQSLLSTLPIVG